MSGLVPAGPITDQDTRTTYALAGADQYPWGQQVPTSDGRVFAYAANQSTSVALAPGKLMGGATTVANHLNQTGVATTVGQQQNITWTIGNTAITANEYQYGFFVVNKNAGNGQTMLIASHNTPSGNGSVTVSLVDGIITATTTASKFSLYPNIYSSAAIMAHGSSTTTQIVGVPLLSIPAATTALPFTCYWSQVGGPCAILADASSWAGTNDGVIASSLTDGAVGIEATSTITQRLGFALDTLVSTEYRPVMLMGIVV